MADPCCSQVRGSQVQAAAPQKEQKSVGHSITCEQQVYRVCWRTTSVEGQFQSQNKHGRHSANRCQELCPCLVD